jgi:hypothetical protein
MAIVNIRGKHRHTGTGADYTYRASFDGYGPDILFKALIPIPARGKVLHVERVLHIDLSTDNAVDAVRRTLRAFIDATDFQTVECD